MPRARSRRPTINVRHLEAFRAVMKMGTVSGAARVLNVSQPAVTKSLKTIEEQIGVPLFRRIKGRLQATSESRLLLPKVDQVFGSLEDVERLADGIAGGEVGRITIATATTLSTSVTATAIARYRRRKPNVVINVQALATRQVVEEVANNQVDLGVTDAASIEGSLETRELCRAVIGCVLPKGHALARRRKIQFRDLAGEQLIAFHETTLVGASIRSRISELGLPLSIALSTNQSLVACLHVRNRLGIALIDPFTILSGLFPDLVIVPLDPPIEIRPRLLFPPSRPTSIATQELIDTIRQTIADLVPTSRLLRTL